MRDAGCSGGSVPPYEDCEASWFHIPVLHYKFASVSVEFKLSSA